MGLFDKLFKGGSAPAVDPASLPNDLKELRKLRDKAKWGKDYVYARKVCEVGVELYRQGKLVAKPGDPNDAGELLGDMEKLINFSHTYNFYTNDPALELLLETGEAIILDFTARKEKDPTVQFSYPVEFRKRV